MKKVSANQPSKLKSVVLNLTLTKKSKEQGRDLGALLPLYIALELITGKKPTLTRSKRMNRILGIPRGAINGLKVKLSGKKAQRCYLNIMRNLVNRYQEQEKAVANQIKGQNMGTKTSIYDMEKKVNLLNYFYHEQTPVYEN